MKSLDCFLSGQNLLWTIDRIVPIATSQRLVLIVSCTLGENLLEYLTMISKENKTKAIKSTQIHKDDVGSPQAQVAILTARINEITEHLRSNKHDHMARRGLLQMVGRRKKLLKSLSETDFDGYKALISKLGIRK